MPGRLTIRRLRADALVAGDPTRLPVYERMIRRLVGEDAPAACGQVLDRMLPADDPAVIRIRRLDVSLTASLDDMEESELVRQWGAVLAQAVLGALTQAQSDTVVRFASRDHLLATFCLDRATGFADGVWYYGEFSDFGVMSPGLAIVAALEREPERIARVLTLLAQQQQLEHVLRVLTRAGERRILKACAAAHAPSAAAADVLPSVESTRPPASLASASGIRWFAATLRAFPDLEATGVAAAIHRMLFEDVQTQQSKTAEPTPLPATKPLHLGQLPSDTEIYSDYASVFLLLPAYESAGCDDDLPELDRAYLRACVLAACVAGDVQDAAIQIASPYEEQAESEFPEELVQRTLRRFAAGLMGFGQSTPAHLRANFLTGAGTIRVTDESIRVKLPAIPLQLLLRIAGWHRREYTVPWLGERVIHVELDGA